ncbi:hypothetical protein [Roseovarius atlanticus]|uniref:hypothetical protein n=1 Tax=Roseovarius atlanticus TaxID=1641875 RepID=UPI001C97418E|nr:hypothetical protein [Roseovarius atlanticus]MBY5987079.1 hypothetical protein [Roseovarius atlanticus]MBY6125719.1 hypothetical protein [Roseovarius atlanticus]MBY6149820.1 hypothetical protein [Roseovarius atlanticus]
MTKTIEDLQDDAVFLAGLIGGAEVLADTTNSTDPNCQEHKLASNSLLPIFEDLRRRANALVEGLERLKGVDRTRGAA